MLNRNKFVTFITNLLFNTNITDMETGFKVFQYSLFYRIWESRRFRSGRDKTMFSSSKAFS
mgnify:CR=1 FL=1